MSVYKVDAAYGEVMAKADGQLKAWRQLVGSGKVVSDFGERVSQSQSGGGSGGRGDGCFFRYINIARRQRNSAPRIGLSCMATLPRSGMAWVGRGGGGVCCLR